MSEGVIIREFTLRDLPSVTEIIRTCLPENYTESFFINLHQKFPKAFLVAEQTNTVVGYILCRIELEFGLSGLTRKGHIVSLAIIQQYRGKGIAKSLICQAINSMRHYKASQAFLEVRVSNAEATHLYTKIGFQVSHRIPGYYFDSEDAYVMVLQL